MKQIKLLSDFFTAPDPLLVAVITLLLIVAGFAAGYLISRTRTIAREQALALLQQQADSLVATNQDLKQQLSNLEAELQAHRTSVAEKDQALSSVDASLRAEQRRSQEHQEEVKRLQTENATQVKEATAYQTEIAAMKTRAVEREENFKQQVAQFQEQKATLKQEFENLANRIFETKGKAFAEKNQASIDELLKPFKTQLKDFRDGVEKIHLEDTKQQTELKTELKQLKDLNVQMTQEAHDLATALKGQKKMQGNWGEMILENVLDRSGLVKDRDYAREVSIKGEDGRSRPDAIVYLPDDKHLIIDAKLSLNAYTRYVNAEDEAERQQAAKEHTNAIADRIRELSDRDYFKLPGLNSPEMVFMFIPIESAFVEAMKADESVFQDALEMNVLVATPTTLLTSLNIVRQLWRFEDQNKHTAQLSEKAGKVYDKLRTFVGSLEKLGMALERAKAQAGAELGQVQDVINAATGANLDPQSALRVAQLAEALEVDASTALQVLAAEQQKMRSLDDPRAQRMLEEVSKRSEVALERDDSYEQLSSIENATDR
ncbi:MAG: DNA recombination protein RmuC, partial [Pseudomonadales bacterium]